MDIFSIILIILWTLIILNGIYGLVKGYFYGEQKKAKNHEPNAYRKWVKLSSVFITLCGVANVIWSILDGFAEPTDWKYTIFIIVTVVAAIIAMSVVYICIVKPADKALGIKSEFDKTLKDNKK